MASFRKDKAAGGREEEEEEDEEVYGLQCTHNLLLIWPTDLCVVTFRQSPGAPETRVTRLASLWLLVTAVSFQGAAGSLTARTVEALVSAEDLLAILYREGPATEGIFRKAASEKARRELREELNKGGAVDLQSQPVHLLAGRRAPPEGDCPAQPHSGLETPLFGQPLTTLCGEEGTLPQPGQDLLAILYREGPATEGIFRKAASEKARRELREELNKGGAVDLQSQPVHLLAVIFKDFLRNIPSRLLSAALFESWMLALEKPSRQEKIEDRKEGGDASEMRYLDMFVLQIPKLQTVELLNRVRHLTDLRALGAADPSEVGNMLPSDAGFEKWLGYLRD
nr:PREDICTED: T-cell activation Rho GTPase-activating protein [Struthio camelus australis]